MITDNANRIDFIARARQNREDALRARAEGATARIGGAGSRRQMAVFSRALGA